MGGNLPVVFVVLVLLLGYPHGTRLESKGKSLHEFATGLVS